MTESLEELATATNDRLVRWFDLWSRQPLDTVFSTQIRTPLFEEVRTLTLRGGKRVRSALVLHGGGLFIADPLKHPALLDASCALELLQTYLLIHDDVMDGDLSRRGGPSVHAALAERYGDPRIGENLGVLAGDLANALVQWLVTQLEVDDALRHRAFRLMAAMQIDVVYGQMLDVVGYQGPEEVARHKTASYTAIGPLCLGATLCGAHASQVEHLGQIGRSLGIAFQLRDDLIGALGDPQVTGKPVGSDLRSGKKTFLLEEALKCANPSQRALIESVLGRLNDVPETEVQKALDALRDCGAPERVKSRIDTLVRDFCDGLAGQGYRPSSVDRLVELAKFVAARHS